MGERNGKGTISPQLHTYALSGPARVLDLDQTNTSNPESDGTVVTAPTTVVGDSSHTNSDVSSLEMPEQVHTIDSVEEARSSANQGTKEHSTLVEYH